MQESEFHTNHRQEPADLESRLMAYYGLPLAEEVLPSSAWFQLRDKLPAQVRQPISKGERRFVRRSSKGGLLSARSRLSVRRFTLRQSQSIPASIQEALVRVLSQARSYRYSPALRCVYKRRAQSPAISAPWLPGRALKLILPMRSTRTLESAELDVLLASGLARMLYHRRAMPIALSFSMFVCLLMALFSLTASIYNHRSLIVFPIAISLGAIMVSLRHWQKRSIAFRADALIVTWLGRHRVCQGLHILAKYRQTSGRWLPGEPTLAERIQRVCGAPIALENERLTLVR